MGFARGGRAEKRESRGKRTCSLTLAAMLVVSPLVAFVSLLTFAPAVAASGVDSAIVGGWHSLALRSDGTVWAWGFNDYGELGDGTTTNRSTPVQVSGLSDVTAIAGGGDYSLAPSNIDQSNLSGTVTRSALVGSSASLSREKR